VISSIIGHSAGKLRPHIPASSPCHEELDAPRRVGLASDQGHLEK